MDRASTLSNGKTWVSEMIAIASLQQEWTLVARLYLHLQCLEEPALIRIPFYKYLTIWISKDCKCKEVQGRAQICWIKILQSLRLSKSCSSSQIVMLSQNLHSLFINRLIKEGLIRKIVLQTDPFNLKIYNKPSKEQRGKIYYTQVSLLQL